MVRSIERKNDQAKRDSGIILPETQLDDDQVASGQVVEVPEGSDYKVGDILFFHKVLPIDLHMKYDKELEVFWFIHPRDVIFKVVQ